MPDALLWPLLVLAAYLVGAIPFGFLLGKARGVDIREHGSGNIGATNLLRVCGKRIGLLGFFLDAAKGAVPVLIAGSVVGTLGLGAARSSELTPTDLLLWLAVGVATMLGHIYPVYLKFKGGKGVATGLGMFLGYWPWTTPVALAALIVWYAVLKTTRYVSVASICAAIALPVCTVASQALGWPAADAVTLGWPFIAVTAALGALVIIKHRTNIKRLRAGTEAKIGSAPPGTTKGRD
jgi:glycerol-3-phosphate acyltransferase PlsY